MSKMKDLKRAYRRHKQYVILKRRAWTTFNINYTSKTWSQYWEEVKSGECDRWMRTLSKPCSCDMCSRHYQRPSKGEIKNIIQDNLLD